MNNFEVNELRNDIEKCKEECRELIQKEKEISKQLDDTKKEIARINKNNEVLTNENYKLKHKCNIL